MMRFRSNFFFVSLAFLLFACGEDNEEKPIEKEEVDVSFEKFYYPTIADGKTRYYRYLETIETDGQDPYSFVSTRRIERNKDTLTFVEYQHFNDTTIAVDSSINLIKADGIHYLASYFSNGSWIKFDGESKGVILPYDWKKVVETTFERSVSKETSELSGRDPMKFVSKVRFQSLGELTNDFEGKKKYAILKGKGKYELENSLPEFEMTYWQLEGFGMYYFEMNASPNKFTSIAEKELTEKEYKALFK